MIEHLGGSTTGRAPDRLVLTSGGTESNNLAILGLARAADAPGPARVIVSSIEHPSVQEAAEYLARQGFEVEHIRVDRHGVCSLEDLRRRLERPARLVSMMYVNNETGVIQPIQQAAGLCQQHGVPMHSDLVQAVGKLPIHFAQWGLSAATVTAHKVHGPRGIGALLLRGDTVPQPLLYGGAQQMGVRPGTEDLALASGFAEAIRLAVNQLPGRASQMAELRDRFEQRLIDQLGPRVVVLGGEADRAPHTSNLVFRGANRQALVMAADLVGICCSSGTACASGSSEPSRVLMAMGRDSAEIEGAVRFSFSSCNTRSEVELAADRIAEIVSKYPAGPASG